MEPISYPDHDLESRMKVSPKDRSLAFAVFIGYLYQCRRFFKRGEPKYRQRLLDFIKDNVLNNYISEVFDYLLKVSIQESMENFMINLNPDIINSILLVNINFDIKSIANFISRIFSIVIIIYNDFSKQEYYSGSDKNPIIVSVIEIDGVYYTGFQRKEMEFEQQLNDFESSENPEKKFNFPALSNFPFVWKTKNLTNADAINGMIEIIESMSSYLDPKNSDPLESYYSKLSREKIAGSIKLDILRKALNKISVCSSHKKACFPCKVVHCCQCFIQNLFDEKRADGVCPCNKPVDVMSVKKLSDFVNVNLSNFKFKTTPSQSIYTTPPPITTPQSLNAPDLNHISPNPPLANWRNLNPHNPYPPPLIQPNPNTFNQYRITPPAPLTQPNPNTFNQYHITPPPLLIQPNLNPFNQYHITPPPPPPPLIQPNLNPFNQYRIPPPARQFICLSCSTPILNQNISFSCQYSHFICKFCSPNKQDYCPICNEIICAVCENFVLEKDLVTPNNAYYSHATCYNKACQPYGYIA